MNERIQAKTARIEVVDALRGFAVLAIMLLHNIEHFNFYQFPTPESPFWQAMDRGIWDTLFFLFAGKAYAIFSLLFGFSFFIQYNNQEKKGYDFRLRFLWRLLLLFVIGCFNGAFFPGDILVLYSIIGIVLVLVCKWSDKAVLITAIILMLQPFEWGKYLYSVWNPDYIPTDELWRAHSKEIYPYLSGTSFWAMVKSNLWDGQLFSILWAWSYGRFFQTAALFLFGMLLGRKGLFKQLEQHRTFWVRVLITGAVCFVPLYFITNGLPDFIGNKVALRPMNTIMSSFRNFAFMSVWVSVFVLLWQMATCNKVLHGLVVYGKMSLTNYLTQSIIGSFIYFGYGFSLYNVLTTSASFAVGLGLFVVQLFFCRWWLSRYKQGPFEAVWKKATWIRSSVLQPAFVK